MQRLRSRNSDRIAGSAPREAIMADPDREVGSIKRRALRRAQDPRLINGKAYGPSVLHPAGPEPTPADRVADAKRLAEVKKQHRKTVAAEVKALDARVAEIDARLKVTPDRVDTYEKREAVSERRQLVELRGELEAESDKPILRHQDGSEVSDRDRAIVKVRTRELRDGLWANAERDAAAGDHRQARQRRVDALRSRHLAEAEQKLRKAPWGYL